MQGLAAVQTVSSASKADGSNKGAWDERPPPAPLLQTKLGRLPSMARPSHVQIQPQAILSRQISDTRLSLSDRISSSGSRSGQESSSLSLAAMVYDFLDDDCEFGKCGRARRNCRDYSCDEGECCSEGIEDEKSPAGESTLKMLQVLVSRTSAAEQKLGETIGTITRALKDSAGPFYAGDGIRRGTDQVKYVVQELLRLGYNAGLCKSKWEPVERQPGGEYEYVEVILGYPWKPEMRLIVDLEFRGHFEIARPTREYRKMLKLLPSTFVGSSETLRGLVNTMCEAAKASLLKRDLHLPPWRKSSYILAKWFSPIVLVPVEPHSPSNCSTPVREVLADGESGRNKVIPLLKDENDLRLESHEGKLSISRAISWTEDDRMGSKELTVDEMGWKPPVVEPRRSHNSKKLAGLAAALRQSEVVLREHKHEQKHFSSDMNVLKQRQEAESAAGMFHRSRPVNPTINSKTSLYSRGFTKGF